MTNAEFEHYFSATTGTDQKLAEAAWKGMAKWDDETKQQYVRWRIERRERAA
jgi:hypothetical protein